MRQVLNIKTIAGIMLLGVSFLASGCTTRLGDFSVIATGAPQYDRMDNAPMQPSVEATSSRVWFLCFPLGGAPNVKEALDKCLDKANGDFMERARIYTTDWSILLFSYGSFRVHGEVGNSKFEQMRAE
jgi:hypothetical protein